MFGEIETSRAEKCILTHLKLTIVMEFIIPCDVGRGTKKGYNEKDRRERERESMCV